MLLHCIEYTLKREFVKCYKFNSKSVGELRPIAVNFRSQLAARTKKLFIKMLYESWLLD